LPDKDREVVRTGKAGKVTLQNTIFKCPFTVGRFQSLSNDPIFPYNVHTLCTMCILPSSLPFYVAVHFDIPSTLSYNLFAYSFDAFFPTPYVYLLPTLHSSSFICYRL